MRGLCLTCLQLCYAKIDVFFPVCLPVCFLCCLHLASIVMIHTSTACSTFPPGARIPWSLDFFSHAWLPLSCSLELMPACCNSCRWWHLIHCVHFLRIFPHYPPLLCISLSFLSPGRNPPFLHRALQRSKSEYPSAPQSLTNLNLAILTIN